MKLFSTSTIALDAVQLITIVRLTRMGVSACNYALRTNEIHRLVIKIPVNQLDLPIEKTITENVSTLNHLSATCAIKRVASEQKPR